MPCRAARVPFRRPPRRRRRAPLVAGAVGLLALAVPARAAGPSHGDLPFCAGERLIYRASVAKLGSIGRGAMWIEGPVALRGRETMRLRFEFFARFGLVRAMDRTESWLDPTRMASLRFVKEERHPLSKHEESVELYPDEQRWAMDDGSSGASPTAAPLDELSFMYFLRTLPLADDTTFVFHRHFDAERNPTTVRVTGRDTVQTGAGRFAAVQLEMRVRDPRRYRGEGVIRLALSDDACRIPLRIESRMPIVGRAVLTLESHTHPDGACGARRPDDAAVARR